MKTIAITIDEPTLKRIAKLALAGGRRGKRLTRSELIRTALHDFLRRHDQNEREAHERKLFARHKGRLDRELEVLIREQAAP